MAVNVTETIFNIGTDDADIDLFENQYKVKNGMRYNSYLILDDKNIVMDTVDARKQNEWLKNLSDVLGDQKVDYLVIQHMEPDHSGSIGALANKYPEMILVGNAKTFTMLDQFNPEKISNERLVVKEGDTLSSGNHTLTFVMAPMVHWPEVMVTYVPEDKLLFSADAFGKFGVYDADEAWDDEARRYYINIVGKYGPMVTKLLAKAATLDIETVCSLHGPVLGKEELPHVLDLYKKWSSYTPETEGVLIAVASAHNHTLAAGYEFEKMLQAKGVNTKLIDLNRTDVHEAVAQAFAYSKLVCMASSYDSDVFPSMETFLNALSHKGYQKRTVALVENGSWAPTAAKAMKAKLEGMKNITLIEPVVTLRSALNETSKAALKNLAATLAE
jgi:flavorubredoxin